MLADVLQRASVQTGVGVYVGSASAQTTTGNQDISLPSGCPDLRSAPAGSWAIMFFSSGISSATNIWTGTPRPVIGFTTGASNSYSAGAGIADGQTTSLAARRIAAKCLTFSDYTAAVVSEADFVSFPAADATHMRVNWTTNGAIAFNFEFVIFTGLTNAKVVNWNPAGTGSRPVTGVGFKPDLVFHAHQHNNAAIPASATSGYLGFGVMNKHGQQWGNAIASQTGANPSNSSRWQQVDACIVDVDWSEGSNMQGHFEQMDSDGFHVNFSVYSVATQIISLCLGGISSKIGAFTKTSTATPYSQTISSRHGFTTRGALFSDVLYTPQASPASDARFTIGATDGVNSRVAHFADLDAFSATRSKATWRNDSVIVGSDGNATGSAADYHRATWSSSTKVDFTLSWVLTAAWAAEQLYILIGDSGFNTLPSMIPTASSVTNVDATGMSSQKHAVTLSTGRMVMVVADTGTNAKFIYSDDGTTANAVNYGSPILGWANGSIASYVDSGGIERLVAVWKQSGTGGSRTDLQTYCMVGTFNTARTTLTWGTAIVVTASTSRNYSDVVALAEGTGGKAFIATSAVSGSAALVDMWATVIDSSGVPAAVTNPFTSTDYGTGVHQYPSLDFDPSTKRIHATWSAGGTGSGKGIRYRTASYSAGVWTWATEVEVDNAVYVDVGNYRTLQCRWVPAASKVSLLYSVFAPLPNIKVSAWESSSFTAFTEIALFTSADRSVSIRPQGISGVYEPITGDIYIIGMAYAMLSGLYYWKWTRATTTLTGPFLLDEAGPAPDISTFSPYAWFSGGKVRYIYTRGNNAPFAIMYDELPV